MDKLDWIERAAIENLKKRSENADLIRWQVNIFLSLILSGGGAALYLAANSTMYTTPALMTSVYLFLLAGILVIKCVQTGAYPATWNEPENLNQAGYELDALREFELCNMQERIKSASRINRIRGQWFNRVLLCLCATPIIGFIAWWIF